MESKLTRTMLFTEQLMREGDMVIAYCPELDVSSCGHTAAKARTNLQTALRLFIEEAAKLGTLRQILTEAGYDADKNESLTSQPQIECVELAETHP